MLSYLRRHHLGLIALFFALTGTSYAVATGSIDSREIRDNSVRSKDVRNNALLSRDLRNNSVRSTDVREGTLTGTDVLDGGLTGGDLANSSLEGLDVRDGTLRDADIGPNSVSEDELTGNAVRSAEVLNGSLGTEDLQGGLLASDAHVRFDDFAVDGGAVAAEDVACPAGDRALGGGVSFGSLNADDRVVFSEPRLGADAPNAQGAVANGWGAAISNGNAMDQRTASVWVVCAAR
jgi:hypothetical protein